jgi:hypothetical protein
VGEKKNWPAVLPGELLGFEQAGDPADLIEALFVGSWLPLGHALIDPNLKFLE